MAETLSTSMRRAVATRAQDRCEYCGKPQISFFPHEVDHVLAQKHGGQTTLDNLALACFERNRYKGSDVASFDPHTRQLTPLFNPRQQKWGEHFRYIEGTIVPLTPEGRVTVMLLCLNQPTRVTERIALRAAGR
jgi:hypothetical protein